MDCKANPDVAHAICDFIKSLLGTILHEKLGVKIEVNAVDCKHDRQTLCKFRVIMDK